MDPYCVKLISLSTLGAGGGEGEGGFIRSRCVLLLLQKTIKPRNRDAINEHNGTVTRAPLNQLDLPLATWQKTNAGASFSHERKEIPGAYLRISHTPYPFDQLSLRLVTPPSILVPFRFSSRARADPHLISPFFSCISTQK